MSKFDSSGLDPGYTEFVIARLPKRSAEALDTAARLFEHCVRSRVRYSKERRQTERRAMDDRHAFAVQEIAREVFIACDLPAVWGGLADQLPDRRIHIEGTLGFGTLDTVRLIEH